MKVVTQCYLAAALLATTALPVHADAPFDFDNDGKSDYTVVRRGYYSLCELPLPPWASCSNFNPVINYSWLTKNSSNNAQQIASFLKSRSGTRSEFDTTADPTPGASVRTLVSFRAGYEDTIARQSSNSGVTAIDPALEVDFIQPVSGGGFRASTTWALSSPRSLHSIAEELLQSADHVEVLMKRTAAVVDHSFLPVYKLIRGVAEEYSQHTLFHPSERRQQLSELLFPAGVPVVGDYDGDSLDDLAVFGAQDQVWTIRLSQGGELKIQWGLPNDEAMPADYDGDGRSDLAVWRPSNAVWYILYSSTNYDKTQADILQFGLPSSPHYFPRDLPVQGDFDGDGKHDIAVYRQSTGTWFVLRSSDGRVTAVQWGLSDDIPVGVGPSVRFAFPSLY